MSGSTSMIELLRHPRDPNWQNGSHRGHHFVLLLKSFCTIILISLVIVEYPLYVHWLETRRSHSDYLFWWRIGMALVPDLIYTIIAFALIFQMPKIVIGGQTWTFHPAFALTFSIVLLGLYITAALFNTLGVYSWEIYPIPDWASVALAEAGFEAVLALAYLWMMVLACVAVHRWRKREEMIRSADRVIQLVERREHGKTDG